MKPFLDDIFTALKPSLERSYSLTMSEGHVKGILVDYLLASGHTILEGGCPGAIITHAYNGQLFSKVIRTPYSQAEFRPDIRIVMPQPITIELQIRSVIGSQNAISSKPIIDDCWRVDNGHADLFILVVDGAIYQRMLGNKEKRGRKQLQEGFLLDFISRSDVRSINTRFNTARHVIFYGRL